MNLFFKLQLGEGGEEEGDDWAGKEDAEEDVIGWGEEGGEDFEEGTVWEEEEGEEGLGYEEDGEESID